MKLAYGYDVETDKAGDITISDRIRLSHALYIGSTGSGKTSAMVDRMIQDVENDQSFCVFDTEGELSDRVLRALKDKPPERVIVFDPTIDSHSLPLNFLSGGEPYALAEEFVSVARRTWRDAWGSRTEDLIRQTCCLAAEHRLSLVEACRLLSDDDFRNYFAERSHIQSVRQFFLQHLRGVPAREWRVWTEAPRNKLSSFVQNPHLEPHLAAESCLDFRKVMDLRQWFIVRLPDGILSDAGRLMASLLLNRLYLHTLRREEGAPLYAVYLDEFPRYFTDSFVEFAVRSRKRAVGLDMAFQSFDQFQDDKAINVILSMCATLGAFQIGHRDATRLAAEFFPPSGSKPKQQKSDPLWGDEKPGMYHSLNEELAHGVNELVTQRQRELYLRVKGEKGTAVYCAAAYDLEEPQGDAERVKRLSLAHHGLTKQQLIEQVQRRVQGIRVPPPAPLRQRRRIPRPDE